jgi:hypothetical protein
MADTPRSEIAERLASSEATEVECILAARGAISTVFVDFLTAKAKHDEQPVRGRVSGH